MIRKKFTIFASISLLILLLNACGVSPAQDIKSNKSNSIPTNDTSKFYISNDIYIGMDRDDVYNKLYDKYPDEMLKMKDDKIGFSLWDDDKLGLSNYFNPLSMDEYYCRNTTIVFDDNNILDKVYFYIDASGKSPSEIFQAFGFEEEPDLYFVNTENKSYLYYDQRKLDDVNNIWLGVDFEYYLLEDKRNCSYILFKASDEDASIYKETHKDNEKESLKNQSSYDKNANESSISGSWSLNSIIDSNNSYTLEEMSNKLGYNVSGALQVTSDDFKIQIPDDNTSGPWKITGEDTESTRFALYGDNGVYFATLNKSDNSLIVMHVNRPQYAYVFKKDN